MLTVSMYNNINNNLYSTLCIKTVGQKIISTNSILRTVINNLRYYIHPHNDFINSVSFYGKLELIVLCHGFNDCEVSRFCDVPRTLSMSECKVRFEVKLVINAY